MTPPPFLRPVSKTVPRDVRFFQILIGTGVILVWIWGAWELVRMARTARLPGLRVQSQARAAVPAASSPRSSLTPLAGLWGGKLGTTAASLEVRSNGTARLKRPGVVEELALATNGDSSIALAPVISGGQSNPNALKSMTGTIAPGNQRIHGVFIDARNHRGYWTFQRTIRTSITAAKPSFDCRLARTPTEKLICGDSDLAQLDVQMVNAYRKLLTQPPPGQFATKIQQDHIDWFKRYGQSCNAIPGPVLNPARRQCVQVQLLQRRDYYLSQTR